MNNEEKIICNEFQTEVFLYLNNELANNRKKFWEKHLLVCNDCLSEMEMAIKISTEIKENNLADIDNRAFNKMIETSVVRKNWLQNIFESRPRYNENKCFYGKAALVGALSIIAIIVSLISRQPVPIKNITNELLDWDGKKVIVQINELKNTFDIINEDSWDQQIIQLNKRIQNLEKKSDKVSFN